MRSFFITVCLLAACGGTKKTVTAGHAADTREDPELIGACVPEWQVPPPSACERDEEGKWLLPDHDPTYRIVAQVLTLEKEWPDSRSMDAAIVKLMTRAIEGDKASECGRQVCRWHRALALHRLGRWTEAFKDFGSVVKDGPNSPYYADVGAWIATLEPHVPRDAYITCLSAYDAARVEARP